MIGAARRTITPSAAGDAVHGGVCAHGGAVLRTAAGRHHPGRGPDRGGQARHRHAAECAHRGRDPSDHDHRGHQAHPDGAGGRNVPKKELVSTLQVLLQARRLRVAPALPEAQTLVRELLNFQVKITPAANETFGAWREGQHDDLVLAMAIAAWQAERCPVPGNSVRFVIEYGRSLRNY